MRELAGDDDTLRVLTFMSMDWHLLLGHGPNARNENKRMKHPKSPCPRILSSSASARRLVTYDCAVHGGEEEGISRALQLMRRNEQTWGPAAADAGKRPKNHGGGGDKQKDIEARRLAKETPWGAANVYARLFTQYDVVLVPVKRQRPDWRRRGPVQRMVGEKEEEETCITLINFFFFFLHLINSHTQSFVQ